MDRNIIKEEVRRALNELSSPVSASRPSNAPQLSTVVNRARQLISMNSQQMASAASSVQNYPKRRRLGHTYQKKQKNGEDKVHELVCLLPFSGSHSKASIIPDYNLTKEDIYLAGAVKLNTLDMETDVRSKIVEVLSTRIDNIASNGFEFVKVLRKTVTSPAVKEGQENDYAMVKTFMGQGKLYVRLTKSPNEPSSSSCGEDVGHDADEPNNKSTPSTSTATELDYEDSQMLMRLKVIFPNHPENNLLDAVKDSITIDDAINIVLDNPETGSKEKDETVKDDISNGSFAIQSDKGMPAEQILQIFKSTVVENNGPTMPITFNRSKKPFRELCRIYKSCSDKLKRPPVVYFISESGDDEYEEEAADIGGPLKEFQTIAIQTILASTDPQLFEGDDDHKIPIHSQQLVLNGFFHMVGEIMAHSLIHGEIWTVGLAKPVKVFLATGCPEKAAQVVSLDDVSDLSVREILDQIRDADEDQIAKLNSDEMISVLMGESGVSAAFLTPNNTSQVAYEIMIYQVVHKRIKELEGIRKGLEVLKVHLLLENHPKLLSLVFPTVEQSEIDMTVLKGRVKKTPLTANNHNNDRAFKFLMDYLDEVGKRKAGVGIKSVLSFFTGSPLLPREITVQFLPADKALPDPDTCSNSVKIPTCYTTYDQFCSAFDSTISIQGSGYGRA